MSPVAIGTLTHRSSTYAVLGALVVMWLLAVAGRVGWHGVMLGLDYSLWFPDGIVYSYRALTWSGLSPESAAQVLNGMYPQRAPFAAMLPASEVTTAARVFYPLASVPFIRLFGMNGLLVIPALGMLLAALVPAVMLLRRNMPAAALVLGGLLLASTSFARWSVANLTDGVVVGLWVLCLPLLPWAGQRVRWRALVLLAVLGVLISLTRQALPLIVLSTLVPWIWAWVSTRRARNAWLGPMLAFSVPAALVFVVTFPRNAFYLLPYAEDAGGKQGLGAAERALAFVEDLVRMTVIEIGQLAVLDRALLLLVLVGAIGAVLVRKEALAYVWLGTAIAGVVMTAWVGAAGVNFRYSLALAPISVLTGAALWRRTAPSRTHLTDD